MVFLQRSPVTAPLEERTARVEKRGRCSRAWVKRGSRGQVRFDLLTNRRIRIRTILM